MAGMAGLEPANAGVKVPCLTTWRHPSIRRFSGKKARDWDFIPIPCSLGWVKGLEPSTPGTTIRCSNQLSYTHQIHGVLRPTGARRKIGTPEGTRTPGLLLRRQLLYPTELLAHIGAGDENRTRIPSLEGWCPDHCATPAFALRGNRQLRYITMNPVSCQAGNAHLLHFFCRFVKHIGQ